MTIEREQRNLWFRRIVPNNRVEVVCGVDGGYWLFDATRQLDLFVGFDTKEEAETYVRLNRMILI